MSHMEKQLLKLAKDIHDKTCGCGDKNCSTIDEIYCWLSEGDPQGEKTLNLTAENIQELVTAWIAYLDEWYDNNRPPTL